MVLVCVTVKIHKVGQLERFPWLMILVTETWRHHGTGVLMRAPGYVSAWQLAPNGRSVFVRAHMETEEASQHGGGSWTFSVIISTHSCRN